MFALKDSQCHNCSSIINIGDNIKYDNNKKIHLICPKDRQFSATMAEHERNKERSNQVSSQTTPQTPSGLITQEVSEPIVHPFFWQFWLFFWKYFKFWELSVSFTSCFSAAFSTFSPCFATSAGIFYISFSFPKLFCFFYRFIPFYICSDIRRFFSVMRLKLF